MNSHYHPYPDLSSPHPPSPDNNNYPPLNVGHHNGHTTIPMDSQQGFHQMNNNNNGPMKLCAGCGGKIIDRYYLLALDRYWHNSCLKCTCCNTMLAEISTTCYTKPGMILCKNDYLRLFGGTNSCSACGQIISPNELVLRTSSQSNNQQSVGGNHHQQQQNQPNVFHVKCFNCSKCGSNLAPGDRYYILAGSVVCENDWHKLIKAPTNTGTAPLRKGKVGRPRRSRD